MNIVHSNTRQDIDIVPTPRIDTLVDAFINSLDVKMNSKLLYRRTLKQFFKWVSDSNLVLSGVDRTHVLQYKNHLLADGKSSLTVGSYLTSVSRFYEWTEAKKYYPNVAKGIKSPKRKQQFKKQPLTPSQATALLTYVESTHDLRNLAIINLLLRTGLRTIEIVRADIQDITYKAGQRVLLVHGKGRDEKDGFVILTDKAFKSIEAYLNSRVGAKGIEPLFTSTSNNNNGKRLTTRTISQIAKESLKATGLNDKSYTAHSLRHTTAVNILRAGGSLEMVQYTLRHANPSTTQIYTATIKEERRLENNGETLLDNLY